MTDEYTKVLEKALSLTLYEIASKEYPNLSQDELKAKAKEYTSSYINQAYILIELEKRGKEIDTLC